MGSQIVGFDALQVVTQDPERVTAQYAALLGRPEPSPVTAGTSPKFELGAGNIRVTVAASDTEPGIAGLALSVDELPSWQRRLQRLNLLDTATRSAKPETVLPVDPHTLSIKSRGLLLAFNDHPVSEGTTAEPGLITGVDHIVVGSSNPEATAALWGARLGLDMRLELSRPEWGVQLMFFRVGDAILEVVHPLDGDTAGAEDHWYGVSWRTDDARLCRERLKALGFEVSDVRSGRKPGSQVFTVRDAPAGVATLIIQPHTA